MNPSAGQNTNIFGVDASKLTSKERNDLPMSSFAYVDSDGVGHLPYKDKEGNIDVNHTRDALARLNQVQGMSDSDRASVKTKLQNALAKADGGKAAATFSNMHTIEADAETQKLPTRIHLLRAGSFNTPKYGKLDVNADDLREFVDNFKAGVGLPKGGTGAPVNFGHKKGDLAAAWIKDMETDGKDLWGTQIEWSRAGQAAVEGKEYKCISAEFAPRCLGGDCPDPENGDSWAQNFLTGAALTNVPMFAGNHPVMATAETESFGDGNKDVLYINASALTNQKGEIMNIDTLRVKAAADLNDDEKKFVEAHKAELSADEQKKFGLIEASNEDKPKLVEASAVKGDEGQVLVEASAIKALNDKVAAAEASQTEKDAKLAKLEATAVEYQTDKAKEFVKGHVARGAIKADQIDKWANRIVNASTDADREEVKQLLNDLPENKVMAAEQGKTEKGDGGSVSASAEMMERAKKLVADDKEGKTTLEAARKTVMASDPDLAGRVKAERDDQFGTAPINANGANINPEVQFKGQN